MGDMENKFVISHSVFRVAFDSAFSQCRLVKSRVRDFRELKQGLGDCLRNL